MYETPYVKCSSRLVWTHVLEVLLKQCGEQNVKHSTSDSNYIHRAYVYAQ